MARGFLEQRLPYVVVPAEETRVIGEQPPLPMARDLLEQRLCDVISRTAEIPDARHGNLTIALLAPVAFVYMAYGTLWAVFLFASGSFAAPILSAQGFVFHGLLVLSGWSYHVSLLTDAGGVPDCFAARLGEPLPVEMMLAIERKGKDGNYRFCRKEGKYKPDRAHYCAQLGRNVLRMDHFCPFVVNVVGHRNYKHFYLFITYTTVAVNFLELQLLHGASLPVLKAMSLMNLVTFGNGLLVTTVLSAALTPFWVFHTYLLCHNMTTIEFLEKGLDSEQTIPYDLGALQNVSSTFGSDWWVWLLPVGGPRWSGLFFNHRVLSRRSLADRPQHTALTHTGKGPKNEREAPRMFSQLVPGLRECGCDAAAVLQSLCTAVFDATCLIYGRASRRY